MSEPRGRGRGRGRGTNRGKALRARGRRGVGRGAAFTERLLLSDEAPVEIDEEQRAEIERKYARRELGSNLDRYQEVEEGDVEGPSNNSPEPQDPSYLLVKLKVSEKEDPEAAQAQANALEEVDPTAPVHLPATTKNSRKGKVQTIEFNAELDELIREKDRSNATRDLKERFRAKSDMLLKPTLSSSGAKKPPIHELKEAPALPSAQDPSSPPKTEMDKMEDFLDELLG